MSQAAKIYYTPEEYLRMEENSLEKHEYFRGEIFLMAGGTTRHNQIVANTTAELIINLRGKNCTTYSSDMRIQVLAKDLFTYADVSVVCGETELAPGRNDTITNPALVVEVLSPSTEKYDRSQKFELYRGLDSFQSYLLVDQERVYVEYHHKVGPNKWLMETFNNIEQMVHLEAPTLDITLANLYERVVFDSKE
jgi:Uma2 family endonuclease